jgi:LysM repeat protein
METPQRSNARLAAILALAAAFVIFIVILASSLGGGSGGNSGRGGGENQSGRQSEESHRKVYVVKPGDSLGLIAHKVGVPVDRLQRLNPHIDPFALHSGDRVKLR